MEMNQVLTEQGDLLYKYLEQVFKVMIFLNSFTLLQMDRLQLTAVYCNRRGVFTTPGVRDKLTDIEGEVPIDKGASDRYRTVISPVTDLIYRSSAGIWHARCNSRRTWM